MRVRCECGAALNLAEAQMDRQLLDECRAVVAELMRELPPSKSA